MPQPKVNIADNSGNLVGVTSNRLDVEAITKNSLVPSAHDYIEISYDSSQNVETVVYKTGGSGGTTVATLTLAYDSNNDLTSITKS